MGCNHGLIFCLRLHHFTIYFIIFLISSSSQLIFLSEGRKLIKSSDPFKAVNNDEENAMLRGKIGSGPPRCVGRCSSCGHCEAIQVPTNPQINIGPNNSTTLSTYSYSRGDYNSNYKPMSWKCKCGNLIFNP